MKSYSYPYNLLLSLGLLLILELPATTTAVGASSKSKVGNEGETKANTTEALPVTRFREFLRLKAVHPDPDYNSTITWLKNQAEEIGLEFKIVEMSPPGAFVVKMTWRGSNQALKAVMFGSHIDVVPVEQEKWHHDAFAAGKDENGDIYARGAQDVRSVGAQYLEAIRNLKKARVTPLRNVFIVFAPDEEVGGEKGAKAFLNTPEFQSMNVGFCLDEGRAVANNSYELGWAERVAWQVEFTAEGPGGHSSFLPDNTAVEKMAVVMNRLLSVRAAEKQRMKKNKLAIGEVNSINLTLMKGGTKVNIIPSSVTMTFDIRISPYTPSSVIQDLLDNVTAEAGPGVSYKFLMKAKSVPLTPLTQDNVWWNAVQEFANETKMEIKPVIIPGGTDGRFCREAGIPTFGFSPIVNTTMRFHDHDEYLNEKVFLHGISAYEKLLPKFFNQP